MPAVATARRWTTATVVGIAALLLALLVPAVARAADAGAEAAFLSAANAERAAAGLPALAVADDLVAVARAHSRTMADGQDLHHNPTLTADVTGWQRVGENVGRGPDATVVHTAFMASPSHRDNLLEPRWTEVGVGVEVRDGRVWVTQVFRLPATAPEPASAAAPAPAAAPVPAPEASPDPAERESARSLVMLSRAAAADAALDATGG